MIENLFFCLSLRFCLLGPKYLLWLLISKTVIIRETFIYEQFTPIDSFITRSAHYQINLAGVIEHKNQNIIISFRHTSKNYGLVMTGQAAAAPVIAIITEFLSPALGWYVLLEYQIK